MNILMLHPHDIYSVSEPWTVRITYIASEFVKRGHRVRLVYHLLDPSIGLEEAAKRQEFPFETIPSYRWQFALFAKMRFIKDLARWADVIHFQKCFPHVSIPSIWAGYRLNKPVHYDWDDWEYGIYSYAPMNRLVGKSIDIFEKVLPKIVDTVSVASDELWKKCRELGVPDHKIFEAHVGADIERFHPGIDGSEIRRMHNIDGTIVLYLGQLHGAQYAELFLHAARVLLDRGVDTTFMVVGTGERFGELFQLAESLRVAHKIVFTGAVEHRLIPKYIAAADVAVACFEDTEQTRCKSPLKVVEYLAMGKAIVATKMGEVVKMLNGGECGILVEPGNVEELANGIQ
ncbi:MAG TPA: glycosyltransferase, partial [Proteobacteria bacterium]|nr:glycosyltransferase [Pseudomonadota bacterium]